MNKPYIDLKGVRVHNLKNIDLKIELNKLIVITGVSGSGNLLWLSTRYMPKVSAGMSRVCRRMPGSFWDV